MYKLSIVNYINTLPFLWGLDRSVHPFDVKKRIPTACGQDFISGVSDISLVPTGFIPGLQRRYQYITGYGIASDGAVRTVKLLSNKPIDKIDRIALDDHSTTSSSLLKVLCAFYWNIRPQFSNIEIKEHQICDAVLMIGDKVFVNEENYKYHYDLGAIWKEWTGKPFVFALWISTDKVEEKYISQLTRIFSKSISSLSEIIESYKIDFPAIDLKTYIGGNIQYKLEKDHMDGLELYLEYLEKLQPLTV